MMLYCVLTSCQYTFAHSKDSLFSIYEGSSNVRRTITAILFIGLIFMLSACGQKEVGSRPSSPTPKAEPQETAASAADTVQAETNVPEVSAAPEEKDVPIVYFTSDISPEGLQAVYDALAWSPSGKLAVKVSTGEPPASNYLRSELIGPLVQSLDGTIVECNTAYGGSRSNSAMHRQVAEDHGFTRRAAPGACHRRKPCRKLLGLAHPLPF